MPGLERTAARYEGKGLVLFNSFQFAVFFLIAFSAFVVTPRPRRAVPLLAASLVFYALWLPVFLPLLLGTLAVNYLLLRRMAASVRRRPYLVLSIAVTLALLCLFKYAAFALDLVRPFSPGLRSLRSAAYELVLPLGISFYSFEIISVAVDVCRGRLGCPTFRDYALFVTFFPHLISGPIMRGSELLPQIESGGLRTAQRTRRGVWLFAIGLVKKTILSDYLLMPFVTDVFSVPGAANGPVHLVAMYGFAFQIYFDFSGYTDMARGIAYVFGFELPKNFEEPYLSRDPTEFWRRWHITLSRWLRDYLYIPLGGNRRGPVRTLVNLMVTMLLGGLWHGAGVNFVVWGGIHGLLLAAMRVIGRGGRGGRGARQRSPGGRRGAPQERGGRGARQRSPGGRRGAPRELGGRDERRPLVWRDLPAIVVTFHLVCLAWIPFRAVTWAGSVAFVRGLFSGGYVHGWPLVPLMAVALSCALHVAERVFRPRLSAMQGRVQDAAWGPWVEGAALGAIFSASMLAAGAGAEFIYFRF